MNKVAYIDKDQYGRFYVREIVPDNAKPLRDWYSSEFSEHCYEIDQDIHPTMLWDKKTNMFYDWLPIEQDTIFTKKSIIILATELINKI